MARRTLLTSLRYAGRGIVYALKTQRNMRVHVAAGIAAIVAAASLRVNSLEWVLICVSVALVLFAELLNTGVETLVDLLSRERRVEAMVIKDVAAGAVLVCCVSAVIVGCVIFLPRLARGLNLVP